METLEQSEDLLTNQQTPSNFHFGRMEPNVIAMRWDSLKPYIQRPWENNANINQEMFNNLLAGCVDGYVQCWVAVEIDEKNLMPRVIGILMTTFSVDVFSMQKNLLVYSMTIADKGMSPVKWRQCFEQLKGFASQNGCKSIVTFSKVPEVIKLAQLLKADVSHTFIQWSVV